MNISYDEFKKAEMKVGEVLRADRVPETDKLIRMDVLFGPDPENDTRQIVSGIAEHTTPEALIGRQLLFITNLEPRTIKGLESNGMLLALGDGETFSFLVPTNTVLPGSQVR